MTKTEMTVKEMKKGEKLTNLRVLDCMKRRKLIADYNKYGDVEVESGTVSVFYEGVTFLVNSGKGCLSKQLIKYADGERMLKKAE